MEELVLAQIRQVQVAKWKKNSTCKLYPEFHNMVQYPKKYTVPKFRIYMGKGSLYQHSAHFKASCGDTGTDGSLLLRQIVLSLGGVAFDSYINLKDDSIQLGKGWKPSKNSLQTEAT